MYRIEIVVKTKEGKLIGHEKIDNGHWYYRVSGEDNWHPGVMNLAGAIVREEKKQKTIETRKQ
jgi:hypothetical protein